MLKVRDLHVSASAPSRAWCGPSTACPSTWPRASSWASSAKSGSGKTVSLLAVMGLITDPNARHQRLHPVSRAANSWACRRARCASCAGSEIAMIFQDPMTALTPVYTIGWQIAEQILAHEKVSQGAPPGSAPSTFWPRSASPTRRKPCTAIRTSCRAACASAW